MSPCTVEGRQKSLKGYQALSSHQTEEDSDPVQSPPNMVSPELPAVRQVLKTYFAFHTSGSHVQSNTDNDKIQHQFKCAGTVFHWLPTHVFNNRDLQHEMKILDYKAIVMPSLMISCLTSSCLERAKGIKSKLGVLLQKPENGITLIIPYPEKPEKKPEKLQKPTPEEAAQWREGLDRVLNNSYGQVAFRNFLQSEFSEENIEFWVACEEFKKTKNPELMAAKAKKIYEDFIQSDGPREVNIDHVTKDVTLRNLVTLSSSTFDLAQNRIFSLMENDSFGRFLRTEQYQELVVS
ncbi:regulator of G-protein signaling 5a [Thalassophryne amazonica]|uniref:regulator of G-protein signaling 5a n=1 Tax=Thalassophryne amazonica TaxID=390379 RepID=UPI001471295D|nr:regulator of G-protein signaling 5a [Thalassophryne amazonica]